MDTTIRAFQSVASRLAENSAKEKPEEALPEHYADFQDVFDKEEFDQLPPNRPWDHAIELKPGSQPSAGKIYPLSIDEQAELDKFIDEHLKTGRIHDSKSPMAAPFFFVKKKDGSL